MTFQKKSLDPKRREFLALSFLLGLGILCPRRLLSDEIKKTGILVDRYHGPIEKQIIAMLEKLSRREIDAETVVDELKKRYAEIDVKKEMTTFIPNVKKDVEDFFELYKTEDTDRALTLGLYYVPAHQSVPPHGHHALLSTQLILNGSLQCRQYERIKKLDDRHLTLLLNREIIMNKGDCILMTENRDNVHWFGSGEEATLLFNMNATYKPINRFDLSVSNIGKRDFVDPTLGKTTSDLILARHISSDEAHEKFSKRSVFGS